MSDVAYKNEKSASRLVCVQLMYEYLIKNCDPDKMLEDYFHFCDIKIKINKGFLRRVVRHFADDIDFKEILQNCVSSVSSIPLISLCILRVAILELLFETTDIPVIINEYLDIAQCFVGQKEIAFINAILDKVARKIRCNE